MIKVYYDDFGGVDDGSIFIIIGDDYDYEVVNEHGKITVFSDIENWTSGVISLGEL